MGHQLAAGAADQPAIVDRALSSGIVRFARRRVDRLRREGVCGRGGWAPARFRVVSVRRLARRGDSWCPQCGRPTRPLAVGLDVCGRAAAATATQTHFGDRLEVRFRLDLASERCLGSGHDRHRRRLALDPYYRATFRGELGFGGAPGLRNMAKFNGGTRPGAHYRAARKPREALRLCGPAQHSVQFRVVCRCRLRPDPRCLSRDSNRAHSAAMPLLAA